MGSLSKKYFKSDLSSTKQEVSDTSCHVYGYHAVNTNATLTNYAFIQMFDKDSDDVTVGTTTPDLSIFVPAGPGGVDMVFPYGIQWHKGLTIAATTTATGSSAPATAIVCNIIYEN